MSVCVAIPVPTSSDRDYNDRALPPYLRALEETGMTPVVIPCGADQAVVARSLAEVSGVLLPGSRFDVEPQRYGVARMPSCAPADPGRNAVDELLLQDAFNLRKPILAICYGVQSLNVWRNGTLIQDLPTGGFTAVNHAPGRDVEAAHRIAIVRGSRLSCLCSEQGGQVYVNSSHHQALEMPGDNLRVVATSIGDNVIEAVELESDSHFVLGVQWHPERTFKSNALSRSIFATFAQAVAAWRPISPSILVEGQQ